MGVSNVKTQSGNRVTVELDGVEVGLIQSLRGSDSYGHEEASGIGDIHVQENVPTVARHSLAVTAMVLKRNNLRQVGIMAVNGDDVLKGMVFDICVYDKDTKKLAKKYIKCTYDSGDLDIQKHAILMQSGMFKALDVVGSDL